MPPTPPVPTIEDLERVLAEAAGSDVDKSRAAVRYLTSVRSRWGFRLRAHLSTPLDSATRVYVETVLMPWIGKRLRVLRLRIQRAEFPSLYAPLSAQEAGPVVPNPEENAVPHGRIGQGLNVSRTSAAQAGVILAILETTGDADTPAKWQRAVAANLPGGTPRNGESRGIEAEGRRIGQALRRWGWIEKTETDKDVEDFRAELEADARAYEPAARFVLDEWKSRSESRNR